MRYIGLSVVAWLTLLSAHLYAEALSLEQVLARVADEHPSMMAAHRAVDAANADAQQAKLPSNPALAFEIENVAGSGELSGTDAAEYTVLLSQELQLGGKRRKRQEAAKIEAELASYEADVRHRSLIGEASKAFYSLLAAQKRVQLAEKLVETAESVVLQAKKRVEAGGASPLESAKAELEAAQLRVEQSNAQQSLRAAQRTLAGMWDHADDENLEVTGNLFDLSSPPTFQDQLSFLKQHPEWLRLDLYEQLLSQQQSIAEAERIPNVEIGAGYRQYEETSDNAWVFEASLPLPLVDRNQGARRAAAARVEQGKAEADSLRIALQRQLIEIDSSVRQAYAAAVAIEKELLPSARKAFELADQGYAQGRFGALELLDAQRSLFEQEASYVDRLEAYHHARADLLTLISTQDTP